MNILYYHQHFSTPSGATGTRSYEFSRKLIEYGHSVTVVCGSYWVADSGLKGNFYKGRRTGVVDGINIIELKIKYSNSDSFFKRTYIFLLYAIAGIKIALQGNYDILFASSTPLTAGIPGIFSKVLLNKPFIFEVRDLWPELPKAMGVITNPIILKLMDWLESITYRSATTCIGLSPGIVKGIKKKVPDKKVVMISNGCDLNLVESYIPRKNNTVFIAVFTGAHGIANGLNNLLDTSAILINKGYNKIQIHFIGDGMLKPELMGRAVSENLLNCKFLDPMPKVELFKYLREYANVGLMILANVSAFYYGTSPNKFFDYIALGLPVINNYPGWLAEMIQDKQCGIAVPPDDPEALANALIRLYNNVELEIKMGNNAKDLAETEFNRDDLGNRFVKCLHSVVET